MKSTKELEKISKFTPAMARDEIAREAEELEHLHDPTRDYDASKGTNSGKTIYDREDEYRRQRLTHRVLSPDREDPFGNATPDRDLRTYKEIMEEQQLVKDKTDLIRGIKRKQISPSSQKESENDEKVNSSKKRSMRWDSGAGDEKSSTDSTRSSWNEPGMAEDNGSDSALVESTRWDTPAHAGMSAFEDTPMGAGQFTDAGMLTPSADFGGVDSNKSEKRNRWEETPTLLSRQMDADNTSTPTPSVPIATPAVGAGDTPDHVSKTKRRSRWDFADRAGSTPGDATPRTDDTPTGSTPLASGTPIVGPGDTTGLFSPMGLKGASSTGTPDMGVTPLGITGLLMQTPLTPTAPDQLLKLRIQSEIEERNTPFSDDELNVLLPKEGYEIVQPPADYEMQVGSGRTAVSSSVSAALAAVMSQTPTPLMATPMYKMPDMAVQSGSMQALDIPTLPPEFQGVEVKPEDVQFFSNLFMTSDVAEADLSPAEIKERKIAGLLLKIKNGSPSVRRAALRQITEKAREYGPNALFNQVLPLMMQSTLEDQERHLLVKVIDRVLYKLDEQVRPYVHKILVVIEPLLIDEDYYARVEGREIISNLAKAAGLATMIATMRPDIDHQDEYVRNTTARAFAVVASALGIPSLLLFLKAVCQSKKSWQARHTGIKIVQQIAILMGCSILPHLKHLVEIISLGLQDEQQKVRTITALALAALAEASTPYGIEAFDCVLRPLWKGITEYRGKGLAAFLKAIGLIIPLMDQHHASYYTREVMIVLIREFSTPDEEMKKIVLKVVKQCVATDGVEADYVRMEISPHFYPHLWIVRNALDKRNYRAVVETAVELANKVGAADGVRPIVEDLKDASEPFRKMTMEAIEQICVNLGVATIDTKLEEQLIDGIIYSFQEMATDETSVILNGFSAVVNCLGTRARPYLPQIAGVIRWRLGTPSARSRQQAADLVSRIAVVIKQCGEDEMLIHLGVYLYEYLGEEYPEVLGSILGALKAIVNVMGMERMMPPVKDLLPRLTPILKNRHEKVQENVIDLIGRIADRGGELVSPKEWDRICFDLLELLKAHKKGIRRATVNTFGYIARTIGPHDVLATLLNNLKVQERQLRVCTTVAIAIVAETCLPYTVLPALMNEYRVPELNIQNGVLKALSFMFEYIGEMGKDYVYSVAPLLEDALMDRDIVHRQTAAWTCKHLSLGVHGLGCEDVLQHLLNFVWPNIFETSPHLIQAVIDAIDGFRVSLGPCILLQYLLQGLFHPARRVREVYWRLYNNVYIGHQDSLVCFYPEIQISEGIKPCNFRRHELYALI